MALKTYKPVTPSHRQLVLVDRSSLYRGKPVKALTEGKSASGGRNNNGRTTVRFRGGGHKQSYRRIDFKRRKFDVTGRVERIEYDPNRTAFIALVRYEDGEFAYILAPQRLAQGDTVVVWTLDRLARSTRDLLEPVARIHDAGARFQSLSEPWADTTSHVGKFIMTVFAGIAEFERDVIREWTKIGRAHV